MSAQHDDGILTIVSDSRINDVATVCVKCDLTPRARSHSVPTRMRVFKNRTNRYLLDSSCLFGPSGCALAPFALGPSTLSGRATSKFVAKTTISLRRDGLINDFTHRFSRPQQSPHTASHFRRRFRIDHQLTETSARRQNVTRICLVLSPAWLRQGCAILVGQKRRIR